MRIWSLHPRYLDSRGLVALWREALLAQAVLRGATKGYRGHPQLARFRGHPSPLACIAAYLRVVLDEAVKRGYRFSAGKIGRSRARCRLDVTRGQLAFEWEHLMRKLSVRDPAWRARLERVARPRAHPLFAVRRGPAADWERGAPLPGKFAVGRLAGARTLLPRARVGSIIAPEGRTPARIRGAKGKQRCTTSARSGS